jgi:hypothetical protein
MVIGEVACCFAIIHHIEDVNQISSANPGGGHPQIVEAVCVCGYPPFLIQICSIQKTSFIYSNLTCLISYC